METDENRARVIGSGKLRGFIMRTMEDPEQDTLLPFAIAAALNVCVDYSKLLDLPQSSASYLPNVRTRSRTGF
jgi:hypothetical protein